jgi:DNA/RNA-binding domain of Phe-tRNA-synthetase-like protein
MSTKPLPVLDSSLQPTTVKPALVWAFGVTCSASAKESAYLHDLLARVHVVGESHFAPERKAAVRTMLRYGKYKPAGRSKPSSEYLLAAALAGEFPLVNGPVDVNNAVSLAWGYPASIFDLAKTGDRLLIRRGTAGESYVFNPSGQEIDLEDLLVVCRSVEGSNGSTWSPCGNPVKDAMATKVFEDARDVVAVVYAPAGEAHSEIEACAARFAELLKTECGAAESDFVIGD